MSSIPANDTGIPASQMTEGLSRQFPKRDKEASVRDVDENGDAIFRFSVHPLTEGSINTLEDYYRESIKDLLRIVRLYSVGKPVIVDAFAFLNAPRELIAILGPRKQRTSENDGPLGDPRNISQELA